MDTATATGQAIEGALKVPGLLPVLLAALVGLLIVGVLAGWWARGMVRWTDFRTELDKERELTLLAIKGLSDRVQNAENAVDSNSHKTLLEVRETTQEVKANINRFEAVTDKIIQVLGDVKNQVAALAAIVGILQRGPH